MKRIDVAVVGGGRWASAHHIPALARHPDVRLTAVVDRDIHRARHLAEQFGALHAFSEVQHLIQARLAEAAVVATPHRTHHPIVSALLSADIPVLVEKPLATTGADAGDLVETAAHRSVLLAVGYTYQYTAAARQVREWVASEIGDLVQVVIEFSSRAAQLYAGVDADDDGSAYSAASGGGQASTQLTHAVAATIWTTGHRLTEVAAFTENRGLPVDVDNVVAFRLSNGATGTATSTGLLAEHVPLRHRISYIGRAGVVNHDLIRATASLCRSDGSGAHVSPHHLEPAYPAHRPVEAFIDVLCGRSENDGPAREAAETVAAIEAVLLSAAERRFVTVPTFLAPRTEN